MKKRVRKAVIPAAGLGTRFLPATKAQPKEMLPIVDRPTIHYVVEEAVDSGITDILIITGRGKRAIEDYFDRNIELERHLELYHKNELLKDIRRLEEMGDIHYIRQKEQLGLGHAILCAKSHIGNEPFAVLLGDTIVQNDTPCTKQLMDVFGRCGCSTIAVERVSKENIHKYGIISGKEMGDGTIEIDKLVEKPRAEEAPSNLGIIGRYVLTPEIFDEIEKTKLGAEHEIQLTDALAGLLKTQKIYGYEFEGMRYDIGDKFDYLRAIVDFGLMHPEVGPDFKRYLKSLK